ncbi:MAG: hypothetical protein CMG71_07200 [Candidatus Marinimicrobia bacterium]|mgnify:CR=1 FL=1|nr:hypothetical protein [Candidatus Neomarinimicrobiota bacterium]
MVNRTVPFPEELSQPGRKEIRELKRVLIAGFILISGLFSNEPDILNDAAKMVRKFMRQHFIPGLSITVADQGTIVWSEGFGFADRRNRERVTPETKMRIGSVSKTVTAAGAALLYDQELLDLDEPVQQYVPYFPEKRWPITTRQLMGHISGIRHYRENEMLGDRFYPNVQDGLEIFSKDTLLFKPETEYSYSSYAWNLVSSVMEGAAGEDFLMFMERNVFNPLEMHSISPEHRDSTLLHLATFYTVRPIFNIGDYSFFKMRKESEHVDNSYKWAGGGFVSNTRDLVLFGLSHLDDTFLKPEIIEMWQASQVTSEGEKTNYGLGWRSGETKTGLRWVGHSGGSVGGRAMFVIIPEERFVIAILVNSSPGGSLEELAMDVLGQFLK